MTHFTEEKVKAYIEKYLALGNGLIESADNFSIVGERVHDRIVDLSTNTTPLKAFLNNREYFGCYFGKSCRQLF